MNVPETLKYAETHEWVKADDGDIVTVGISDYAQLAMTELVYIELPELGRSFAAKEEIAVVESVKSASDIYCPVAGEVVAVNEDLVDNPAMVNESPFDNGWLFKIKISAPAEMDGLLDAKGYAQKIG